LISSCSNRYRTRGILAFTAKATLYHMYMYGWAIGQHSELFYVHTWLGLRDASLYIYNTALRSRVHALHASSHSLCSLASQNWNFIFILPPGIAKSRLGARLLLVVVTISTGAGASVDRSKWIATLDEWSRADPWMLPLDSGWVGTAGLIHTIQFACIWMRGNYPFSSVPSKIPYDSIIYWSQTVYNFIKLVSQTACQSLVLCAGWIFFTDSTLASTCYTVKWEVFL